MKHFTLSDNTVIKNTKQVAIEFVRIHAEHAALSEDLATLKTQIKANDGYAWAAHNIALSISKTNRFDQKAAKAMLKDKGATDAEIESLSIKGTTQKVSINHRS